MRVKLHINRFEIIKILKNPKNTKKSKNPKNQKIKKNSKHSKKSKKNPKKSKNPKKTKSMKKSKRRPEGLKGGPKGQKEARPELLVFGNTYFDCDVQQFRCIERPLIATPSMYWR